MMRPLIFLCAGAVAFHPASSAEFERRIQNLTLEGAIDLAEQFHPDLVEVRALEDAAKARRAHTGRLSNPEAIARIESAPMSGRAADSAEYVAGVSQTIPLGGRLSAAGEVARLEVNAAAARVELRRRELRSGIHGLFATALYFDSAFVTFSNNLAGAQSLTRMTKARVEAGDALREDLARAEVDELSTRVEMRAAEAARRLAMADLAAAVANQPIEIVSLSGSLTNALALPEIERAAAELAMSLRVAVAEADAAALRSRVQLARSQRIPDINLDLFYRRLQETRQDAFDAGLRVPIPFFTGTRARIREANAEAEAADARATAARLSAQQQFHRALADLNRSLESARWIHSEILPRAELVLTNAEARYKLGDTSLADILQKRRERNATQVSYLQSLRDVHDAWRLLRLSTDGTKQRK